ncbi:MAG: epoxyqueuosine reductase QueH [Candidatus Gastranaerophilaceae bacterium]
MSDEKKILLHACCGICSGEPIRQLLALNYKPVVYFCNPNIDTKIEFDKRLDAQRTVCKYFDVPLLVETYCPAEYINVVKGYENEPERGKRCILCFNLRLLKSAYKAKELGISYFTTSMVISPHKNFKLLSDIGTDIASHVDGVDYFAVDFKKKDGFLKTNKLSKELNLYRQNYCGCKFAKNIFK